MRTTPQKRQREYMNYEYENSITVDLTQSSQNKRDKLSLKKSKPISPSATSPRQTHTVSSSSSLQRQHQTESPQEQQPQHHRSSLFRSSENNGLNYNTINTYNNTGVDDNIGFDDDDDFDDNVCIVSFAYFCYLSGSLCSKENKTKQKQKKSVQKSLNLFALNGF